MTIRVRLILAFATILALFAVTQAIQVRSDRQRTKTMTELGRALRREILIGRIGQSIADLQRQVALLSQIEGEPGESPAGRDIVTAEIDKVSDDIRILVALSDPVDAAEVGDLQQTYAKLADAWKRFYDYLGTEAGWATAFQVKAEPLAARVLNKGGLLPRLQAAQTAHVFEAQAQFDRINRDTSQLDLGIFAASMLVSLGVAFLLARHLTTRLADLNRGVAAVATMNLDHRITIRSRDELGQVGEGFNAMAESLSASRQALSGANEELLARNAEIDREHEVSQSLLRNILPEEIATELAERGEVAPRYYEDVTILFTDFVGFTLAVEKLAAEDVVGLLHTYFKKFDEIAERYGLEKLKTIGDSYFCAAGLPRRTPSHPVDALLAALEMVHAVGDTVIADGQRWSMRVGLHSGPVVAGVVGTRKFAFDVWGDTVNVASRMQTAGRPNRVNVSAAMHQRVKDFFVMEARGRIQTKEGKDLEMYEVLGVLPGLTAGGGLPPQAFARRYRTYFDKPLTTFPEFPIEAAPVN
jgi:class 3 adenylate cyclase/HAMP domain-containing protein